MSNNNKGQLIFRNEWKHSMDQTDYIIIRSRLAGIAEDSMYAGLGGMYRVRSLAFAEQGDAKRPELLASIGKKESFRIRYYNENLDYIRLEKKTRVGGKSNKQSAPLTEQECRSILSGDVDWMADSEEPLLEEFYQKMKSGKIAAQSVADYQREAFVYRPCNVRITMDSRLHTGILPQSFLDLNEMGGSDSERTSSAEMRKEAVLMEVKYDCFLPEVIRAAIRIKSQRSSSFSRYETRHAYGQV